MRTKTYNYIIPYITLIDGELEATLFGKKLKGYAKHYILNIFEMCMSAEFIEQADNIIASLDTNDVVNACIDYIPIDTVIIGVAIDMTELCYNLG